MVPPAEVDGRVRGQAVELLRAADLPFETVDVLAEEDSRRQVPGHGLDPKRCDVRWVGQGGVISLVTACASATEQTGRRRRAALDPKRGQPPPGVHRRTAIKLH